MLALSEILKNLTPIKRAFHKGSSFRKHVIERITDLLAIVLSIYLALNIEGWAEKRIEHKRLVQYYHSLAEEIAKDTLSLSEVLSDAEKHISSTELHIRLLRKYNLVLQDTVTGYFRKMLNSQLFYSSQMLSYQSMILSGDIRLIDNLKVRDKLIELEEMYKSLKIYEDMYLDFLLNKLTKVFSDGFDLMEMKLTDTDFYTRQTYRNLIVEFYSLNINRQDQYREALKKAVETRKIILNEIDINK